VLTGCSAPAPVESAPTTPSATAAPEATPAPVATTAAPIDPADYTCETILPPATLAVFDDLSADGFTLQDDFVERSRQFGGTLADFADYGGILCQWAYPTGANPVDYGFSPITSAQAESQMSELMSGGFIENEQNEGILVVNENAAEFTDSYFFADGYWFYANDPKMLGIIVDNVPNL
jgi:hypothetical protein